MLTETSEGTLLFVNTSATICLFFYPFTPCAKYCFSEPFKRSIVTLYI